MYLRNPISEKMEYGSTHRVAVWLTFLCMCHHVTLTLSLDTNDIQSYLRNLDITPDNEYSQDVDIGASWGIDDTTAIAGKVFKYSIPKDLFHKDVSSLKVIEKGLNRLPEWLDYDESKSVLQGVPTNTMAGKDIHLEISSQDDNKTTARDVFTIKILEDTVHADTTAIPLKNLKNDEALQPIKCPQGSSVTMATVIVDIDMSILQPSDRVGMMENMCRHLGMPTELVGLQPVGNKPMFDSLALVAGPGDVKQPMHSGAMLQWEVGCGNVFANHMPILQKLENTAHDGSMGQSVGHGIIGWHVTNNKPRSVTRIKRRAIQATPTPDTLPPLPTKHAEGSTRFDKTDEPGVPPSRTIPTLATPDFPEIKPTHTDHHHHHTRGPKTHGRHHDHTTSIYTHPSHTKPRIMPTQTTEPIMPTRVTDLPGGGIHPSHGVSSPGVSRSEGVIEPSMTTSHMLPTSSTEIMPTRTIPLPVETTSKPVKPTTTETFTPPTKQPPIISSTTSMRPVTKPPTTTTKKPITKPMPEIPEETNNKPVLNKEGLIRIELQVGDILDLKIPEDNFEDYEDGNTRNLQLTLTTIDLMDLPPDSWLRLDQKKQRLYGLPLPEHVGKHEYLLAAIDSGSSMVHDIFEIIVNMRPGNQRISHELSMVLKLNFHKFLLDVEQRIDVAKKLARAYGDRDMSGILVTNIAPGSVVYTWTNKTIPTDECPESALLALTNKLISPNGSINPEFKRSMRPYEVGKAEAEFKGPCEHMGTISTDPEHPKEEVGDGGDVVVAKEPKKTSEEDVLVTTVAPAVVIAAMLLLGALIACILYRKRRKGKLSDEDQHTFLQKGIPIILPDELDDKPEPPTKPLIMTDEKPPQPPPSYPHSTSPSTPRSDHKEPLLDTDDEAEHGSPFYRPPPPPMTGSLGHRNSRPRTPQSQRSPPQYMSPISP